MENENHTNNADKAIKEFNSTEKDLYQGGIMNENEIAKEVVDAAFHIHNQLGPGLLESAYQKILCHELSKRSLQFDAEILIPIQYDGLIIDLGYCADIIVENKVILELKSVEVIQDVHKKQLLTYLKVSGLKLGLLINFGAPLIKNGITRIVNNLNV